MVPEFDVHDRCRKAREYAHLTQEELAEEIGVSPRTISRYESGSITNVRKIVLNQWALRCGVNADWLRWGRLAPGGEIGSGAASRSSRPGSSTMRHRNGPGRNRAGGRAPVNPEHPGLERAS